MKKKIGSTLVVGTGISGIRSALDLAETGYQVILIDRSPNLGGILTQLDYQFPSDHCGMCKMLPLVERDLSSQYCLRKGLFHENIDIMLSTELVALEGEAGKFQVTLQQKPTMVDPELCIGCGLCYVSCLDGGHEAVEFDDEKRLPKVDEEKCIGCALCQQVCPVDSCISIH